MKYVLMNKNTEILVAEYNSSLKVFTELHEIKHIEYAPIILFNSYKDKVSEDFLYDLTVWFKNRGIPNLRDNLETLLNNLNIETNEDLLDKAYGLSLSDQYWIKPYSEDIKHEDINFFKNNFNDIDFTNATFSSNVISKSIISLFTPNNTTDGRLKKTWIIENDKRYLIKGGYKNNVMHVFNEVLATMICRRLGFNHVPYSIDIVNDEIVSKCPCIIDENKEIVPAYQILKNQINKENAYEEYISILESKGIKNARKELENMYILDYLILNEDRHLNNFGIIRDVNTLEWLSVCPIFDSGQSLNILDHDEEEIIVNGQARFFYDIYSFDYLLHFIKDIKVFDLSSLDDLSEEFKTLLKSYQNITKMSDNKINKIINLLEYRIDTLKELQKEN